MPRYPEVFIVKSARYHHERLDGSGYYGLKQIPLLSRMIAIADVYDAIINERPYKEPLNAEYALQILESEKYDQNLLKIFKKTITSKVLKEVGVAL